MTNSLAMRRNCVVAYSIVAAFLMLSAGCSRTDNESRTTLRLSMIPTTDPGIIRESQPFLEYLQKKTGAKVELTFRPTTLRRLRR